MGVLQAGVATPLLLASFSTTALAQTPELESTEPETERLIAQAMSTEDDNGWYFSIGPSLVFGYPVDVEADDPVTVTVPAVFPGAPPVTTEVPVELELDTDTGFGINGAVGYRFDDARVELEVAYTSNDVDGITLNDLDEVDIDGDIESFQFMVSGYYDIPTQSRFSPYVGGGVGLATLEANDVEATLPTLGEVALDGTGTSFVFQVKAGVNYQFSDRGSAFLGYRLHGIPGQEFEALDSDLDTDTLFVHSLQLGGRFEF